MSYFVFARKAND